LPSITLLKIINTITVVVVRNRFVKTDESEINVHELHLLCVQELLVRLVPWVMQVQEVQMVILVLLVLRT